VTLRLGTRGSALAKAQATTVARALTLATGREVELVEVVTEGDRSTAPVQRLGVGVFVNALRDALSAKDVDVAVHSYKDLPTAMYDGLVVAAVPTREDPRDALVTRDGRPLAALGPGTKVGTGSVRRAAQLAALDQGLVCVPLRGNVDTRLRRLADGNYDAVVLAAAGLHRLGRGTEIAELLDPSLMLPAPAQGALAVECRADDTDLVELLGCLDDEHTRAAVDAERALLAALEAGCSAPVAALAVVAVPRPRSWITLVPWATGDVGDPGGGEPAGSEWEVQLRGGVFSPDGSVAIRASTTGRLTDATEVGQRLAAELLADGAETLLGVHG
jgi:hydroxymethylbilane synthase